MAEEERKPVGVWIQDGPSPFNEEDYNFDDEDEDDDDEESSQKRLPLQQHQGKENETPESPPRSAAPRTPNTEERRRSAIDYELGIGRSHVVEDKIDKKFYKVYWNGHEWHKLEVKEGVNSVHRNAENGIDNYVASLNEMFMTSSFVDMCGMGDNLN